MSNKDYKTCNRITEDKNYKLRKHMNRGINKLEFKTYALEKKFGN